jgi:hypothetical protein
MSQNGCFLKRCNGPICVRHGSPIVVSVFMAGPTRPKLMKIAPLFRAPLSSTAEHPRAATSAEANDWNSKLFRHAVEFLFLLPQTAFWYHSRLISPWLSSNEGGPDIGYVTGQVSSSDKAYDLYAKCALFESQPGHRLSGIRLSVLFFSPSRKMPGEYFLYATTIYLKKLKLSL